MAAAWRTKSVEQSIEHTARLAAADDRHYLLYKYMIRV